MATETLLIGAVAGRAGVNPDTLRYYERRGLLPKPERSASGYRRYSSDAVHVVRFIKRAQELGFTLSEIEELLRLRAAPVRDRDRVRKVATAKIADIDNKTRRLDSMRRALAVLVDSCSCNAADLECPILEALNEDS